MESGISSNSLYIYLTCGILALSAVAVIVLLSVICKRIIARFEISGQRITGIKYGLNCAKGVIGFITAVLILETLGINVSSMVKGLGVATVIIAFTLQEFLQDLISGFNIITQKFFAIGDVVKFDDIVGTVISFNVKSTKIKECDTGNVLSISNRNISKIVKLNDLCYIPVYAGYEEPAELMREICKKISVKAAGYPEILSCEFFGTEKFADDHIEYLLLARCHPAMKHKVTVKINGLIQDVFAENGLKMPYRHMDVLILNKDKNN